MRSVFRRSSVLLTLFFAISLYAWVNPRPRFDENTPFWTVLEQLGKKLPMHAPAVVDPELVEKGRQIVTIGRTTDVNGKRTKRQSRHFTCNDCHNTVQEDPDLKLSDPDLRLSHGIKNNVPFL